MLPDVGLSGLAALLLAALPVVLGLPGNFTRRNMSPNDLSSQFGALFVVASSQTSCEMALIDSSAGFVPASCLSYTGSGSVDQNIDYRVAVTSVGSTDSQVYSVTMADAHPDYNPTTQANNIAVLQWGNSGSIKWHQNIGQDRPSWSDVFYTRRTMTSVSKASWNTPAVLALSGSSDPSGCGQASNLYKSNTDWLTCISQTTTSIANGNCQTPYGAAWAVYQPDNVAVAALYSHSAIYNGNELCGTTGDQYHYYTLLQPYTAWASKMTGRKVYTYASDSSFSYSGSSSFGMENNLAPAVFGVNTVSGDLYPSAKEYTGPPPSKPVDGGNNNNGGNPDNGGTPTTENNGDGGDSPSTATRTKTSNKSNAAKPTATNGSNDDAGQTDGGDTGSSNRSHTSHKTKSSKYASDSMTDSAGSEDAGGQLGEVIPADGGSPVVPEISGVAPSELSKTAIIAMSVSVPCGTIVLILILFFVYRWWRKRKNARNWDPKSEAANIDRVHIIEEIGGSAVPEAHLRHSVPPSYYDQGYSNVFEPVGKA